VVGVPTHACSIDFEVIMSFSRWPRLAALALLPMAAIAQQAQELRPTDPNAPVPALGYVSAFKTEQAAPEEQAAPDTLWRAANEEVANQDAQAGHGNAMAMPGKSDAAVTANPSASRAGADAKHGSHHH
jgi:hypothetical protein